MPVGKDTLRDWHRLFGLLLTDFFTASPFKVEIERDLSEQQQFLDVVILRRTEGEFIGRLPDGLDGLAIHNLITFKSHHETLDEWAMKELIGHYVAYRKLVSATPSDLLPETLLHLYAVCARFPQNLSRKVPWHERQPSVYDCLWGTDVVRVIVAGQLSRDEHNAPLHLFSASPDLVGFGSAGYRQRSNQTSLLMRQLFGRFELEGIQMSYTMQDFIRDYLKEEVEKLTPDERHDFIQSLPFEERLAGIPTEELQRYVEKMAQQSKKTTKSRKKK